MDVSAQTKKKKKKIQKKKLKQCKKKEYIKLCNSLKTAGIISVSFLQYKNILSQPIDTVLINFRDIDDGYISKGNYIKGIQHDPANHANIQWLEYVFLQFQI